MSRIIGLWFASVMYICAFIKYASEEDGNLHEGNINQAIAYEVSQNGRVLRQNIHIGMNIDAASRPSMDGIIAYVGGWKRGEFNLRFGQPSKDVCYIMPELFPFTDTRQKDSIAGKQGGLLDRMIDQENVPKIMFTNSSAEDWRGDAAFILSSIHI